MISTREERIQQRLRGAQRRQVKDVDFSLSFPAAPNPQQAPTTRRTPQPEIVARTSNRQTPGSRRRGRPSNAALAEENKESLIYTANNANISAKRRKLESDDALPSSTRSTRSSLHLTRADIYALSGDQDLELHVGGPIYRPIDQVATPEQRAEVAPTSVLPQLRNARTPSLPAHVHEEIAESPSDAPGSGHRMRVGLKEVTLRSSQLQDVLQTSTHTQISSGDRGSPVPQRKRKMGATTPTLLAPVIKQIGRGPQSQIKPSLDDLDELSPEQLQFGQRNSDPIDELDELSPEQPRRRGRQSHQIGEFHELSHDMLNRRRGPTLKGKIMASEEEIMDEILSGAEETNNLEAATRVTNNRSRRISRNMAAADSPDLDEVTEPTSVVITKQRTKAQKSYTAAKRRNSKKSNARSRSLPNPKASYKRAETQRPRIGSPIPVTVHRLTKKLFYDNNVADADVLNSHIPYSKRGGVNPIDVLSQICQEIVRFGLDTLEEGRSTTDDPVLRREYSTKWRALEAFREEMQTRLLEHTINLDNSFSLRKRVRDEQKKKLSLREDILRVRGEREKVALRMDEIRMQHENDSKSAQERDNLNTNIHDIELAIEQAKEQHPTSRDSQKRMAGARLLLTRVAKQVSNKSDTGGMLRQIKDFNAFLERAALALEVRKV